MLVKHQVDYFIKRGASSRWSFGPNLTWDIDHREGAFHLMVILHYECAVFRWHHVWNDTWWIKNRLWSLVPSKSTRFSCQSCKFYPSVRLCPSSYKISCPHSCPCLLILIKSSNQSSVDADVRNSAFNNDFRPRRFNCHLYQVLLPHVDLMIIPLTIRVKLQLVMHQKLKLLLQWNLSQKRKMTWKCNVATLFNATIFTATEIFLCSNETPTMCSGSHFKFTVKGTLKMDQSKFGFSLSWPNKSISFPWPQT